MAITHIYLRASTDSQDALRAKESLEVFAASLGLHDTVMYAENESGATLVRPELTRLLSVCKKHDILLIESVDRLTRLSNEDWQTLKGILADKKLRLVVQDLPLSHQLVSEASFTDLMMQAINNMMIEMMSVIARNDYLKRRERAAQGIKNRKARDAANPEAKQGYLGRPVNTEKNAEAIKLFKVGGHSWSEIQNLTGLSRGQLAKLKKTM